MRVKALKLWRRGCYEAFVRRKREEGGVGGVGCWFGVAEDPEGLEKATSMQLAALRKVLDAYR